MRLLVLLLIPFSVFAQSGEDAVLDWFAPTQLVDGRPLEDLSHYNIYVNGVLEDSTSVQSFTVPNIPFGTTDFYVTAVRTNGIESAPSNTESKTVVDEVPPLPPVLLEIVAALKSACDRNGIPNSFREVCSLVASL